MARPLHSLPRTRSRRPAMEPSRLGLVAACAALLVALAGCPTTVKTFVLPNQPAICRVAQMKEMRTKVPKLCTQIYCGGGMAGRSEELLRDFPQLRDTGAVPVESLVAPVGSAAYSAGVCQACTELTNFDVAHLEFVCEA